MFILLLNKREESWGEQSLWLTPAITFSLASSRRSFLAFSTSSLPPRSETLDEPFSLGKLTCTPPHCWTISLSTLPLAPMIALWNLGSMSIVSVTMLACSVWILRMRSRAASQFFWVPKMKKRGHKRNIKAQEWSEPVILIIAVSVESLGMEIRVSVSSLIWVRVAPLLPMMYLTNWVNNGTSKTKLDSMIRLISLFKNFSQASTFFLSPRILFQDGEFKKSIEKWKSELTW